MGNRLARAARQGPHPAFEQAEARRRALVAGLKQQLQAQTDAQQGLARGAPVGDRFGQAALVQPLHRWIKSAHPRQHQGRAVIHLCGAGHRLHHGAEPLKGPLHRVQIAHAVVDQAKARHGCGERLDEAVLGWRRPGCSSTWSGGTGRLLRTSSSW